ncbi:MOSC domain-containing protein [Spongiibacter tropicus]|uniref:MOSC domain-containing protein n=1 Tax=Spongiibacter tropicus TaxID=454602 RepID=UPI003A98DC85
MNVSALWRYPVKSLTGNSERTMTLDRRGPAGDRCWMLVDERGHFLTQRQLPSMCRLHAEEQAGGVLLHHLDRGESIWLEKPCGAKPVRVVVWKDSCEALDAGDAAAQRLSAWLGQPVRLCYQPDDSERQIDLTYARAGDQLSFADGFPFLLCTEASLRLLEDAYGDVLAMQRFRPNIVVAGATPFAELTWRRLRIGDVDFDVVKPCTRCVIPSLDPRTGERQRAVSLLLRDHCKHEDKIVFGQNLIHRSLGEIRCGDPVSVLA